LRGLVACGLPSAARVPFMLDPAVPLRSARALMMAQTSDSPPPALDAETVAAVRATLARYARDGDHTGELREVLMRVAVEARAKGILAERLLVVLKEIWGSLPEVRYAERSTLHAQQQLLQRLITRCIEQYYS